MSSAEMKCSEECKPQHRILSQTAFLVYWGKKDGTKGRLYNENYSFLAAILYFLYHKKGRDTFFLLMAKNNKVLTLFHSFICRFRICFPILIA